MSARPDELRVFLEEAAGVTKYKERRKETGHRLEDASENLARVDDIRNELDGQVSRLEVQAEVAREYRDLHVSLSRTQTVLWLKKRNDARVDSERLARAVEEAVNRVEGETARARDRRALSAESLFTISREIVDRVSAKACRRRAQRRSGC